MVKHPIRTYEEFWPFYLTEHRLKTTRVWHVVGTLTFVTVAGLALCLRRPWLLAVGPVLAYSCAWYSHFTIERNRPATFRYPLWSLRSDFRMTALLLTGRLPWEHRDTPSDEGSKVD